MSPSIRNRKIVAARSFLRPAVALTLIAMFVGAPSWPALALARSADGPQLVIDSPNHNFGDVFSGEQISHVFHIRNSGTGELQLADRKAQSPKSAASLGL